MFDMDPLLLVALLALATMPIGYLALRHSSRKIEKQFGRRNDG